MARIRSIHPGWFTDDAVMGTSIAARLFLIGLWGECDDQGIFQWKPLTLKARIVPADSVDVATLLDELVAQNFIKRFSHGGADFGVVRNFCRFQRPKKPNRTHFMPVEYRTYAGIKADGSPPDDDEGGGSGEPVPHRSGKVPAEGEEGNRRGEKGRGPQAVPTLVNPNNSNLSFDATSAREARPVDNSSESDFLPDGKIASDSAQGGEPIHPLLASLQRMNARGSPPEIKSRPGRGQSNGAAKGSGDSGEGVTLAASPPPAT